MSWILSRGPTSAADGRADATDSLPVYTLEPVEVIGRAPSLAGEGVLLASSVVEGRSLDRAGVLGLTDVLAPLPGVRVARFGAPGSFGVVSVRGTRNEQILVLVDGRRLSPAQGGGVDLGAIDSAALERVEVLRGGASALYGGGALGGVVNLVTRPLAGRPAGTALRMEGGSFGTLEGALRHELALGSGGRLWLLGHGLRTRGDYPYIDRGQETVRKNSDARTGGGTLGLRLGTLSRLRLTADGEVESGEQGVPGTVEFPTPEARRSDRRASTAAELVLDDRAGSGNRLAVNGQWLRQRRNYTDPPQGIADRHINRSAGIDLRLDHSPAGTVGITSRRDRGSWLGIPAFTAGVEGTWDDLASTTDGERNRRSVGLYLRGQLGRDRLLVAPAARLDVRSDGSPSFNPRLGVRVGLTRGLDLRLAAGRSYRPPSFDDLFFPDVGGAMGNPDLLPEHALDLEIGIGGGFGRPPAHDGTFAVNLYRQVVDDLIQWSPGPDGRWRPHNVGRAVVQGMEAEARTPLVIPGLAAPAELSAALDLLDPRNRTGEPNVDGRLLPYRPAVEGHLELTVQASSRLRFASAWQAVGKSFATEANTKSIPGHGLLDLTAELVLMAASPETAKGEHPRDSGPARRAADRLVASLALLNVTDIAAVDVRDYPLPGREWRLGLRFAASEER